MEKSEATNEKEATQKLGHSLMYIATLFVCTIVILFPLYSVNVFATGTQNNVHSFTYLTDSGVHGYIDDYAEINMTMEVEVDNDNVTNNQVYYEQVGGGSSYFASCEADSNYQVFTCRASDSVTVSDSQVEYLVRVLSDPLDPNSIIASLDQQFQLNVDDDAPSVSLNVSRDSQNLIVDYSLSDASSGVYKYRITAGSYDSGEIQVSDKSDENPVNNFENITEINIGGFSTGNYDVEVWVQDRINGDDALHENSVTQEIHIDNNAPQILDNTFNVTGDSGDVMDYIPVEGTELDFEVKVNESSGLDKVVGDFSVLNAGADIEANCQQNTDLYECSWDDIHVNASGSVQITAIDQWNTSSVSTVPVNYDIDTTAPVFEKVRTNHFYQGKSYLSGNNDTFLMDVQEAESGMSQNQVWLNYEMVESGAQEVQADDCQNISAGHWRCRWSGIDPANANSHTPTIYVLVAGDSLKDDTGNKGESPGDTTAYIDMVAPNIKSLSMHQPLHHDYAVEGDSVTFSAVLETLNMQDFEYESPIPEEEALANFSGLVENVSNYTLQAANNCYNAGENTSGTWVCNWTVDDVRETEGIYTVDFSIKDAAGNLAEGNSSIDVRVYPLAPGNDTHFDLVKGDRIPSKIDRKVISELEGIYNIFQDVKVDDITGQCKVLDAELEQCFGPQGTAVGMYGEQINISDFFLKFEVQSIPQKYMKDSPMYYNCTFTVDGVCASGYVEDEVLNETVELPLYNSPIGEVSDALTEKVSSSVFLVDKGWTQYIDLIAKILKYVENVCEFYKTMAALNELLNSLTVGLWSVLSIYATVDYEAAQGTWESLKKYACTAKDWLGGGKLKNWLYSSDYKVNNWGVLVDSKTGKTKTGEGRTYMNDKLTAACAFVTCAQCDPKMSDLWFDKGASGQKTEQDGKLWQAVNPLSNAQSMKNSASESGSGWLTQNEKVAESDYFKDFAKDVEQASIPTPEKSIITAVSCRCIPGVLFHIRKMRQLECKYLWCVQNMASIGAPITACEEQLKTDKCVYIWGAILYAFPLRNALGYINDFVREAIANLPAIAINKVKGAICPAYVGGQKSICSGDAMNLATGHQAAICGVMDAAMFVMTIDKYLENAIDFDQYFDSLKVSDFCKKDGVEDLIDEISEQDD